MIIYCNSPYATVYPGASLMALKVVFPELLELPLMVIVILLPNPRYHSRVSPAARLRKINLHCVVIPSPAAIIMSKPLPYETPLILVTLPTWQPRLLGHVLLACWPDI